MNKTGQIILVTFPIILATFLIVFLGHPSVVSGQDQTSESFLGVECKTMHTFLADGLKQFPSKHPVPRGYVKATFRGLSRGNPVTEKDNTYNFIFLMLVTEDGQNLNIKVIGSELNLAFLAHEIWSNTGKYEFWDPVLEFKGKFNDWVYDWYEIEVVGRILREYDDPQDIDKLTGYQNEVYR